MTLGLEPGAARPSPVLLALGGLVALAGGMGIGRFILTPALPMMASAGLTPGLAGFVASANFAGYLAGALMVGLPLFRGHPRRWLVVGLVVSALSTAAMAVADWVGLWIALRFLGGVASAVILVTASTLVLARLRARGEGQYAWIHFAGVGSGIAITALLSSPWVMGGEAWRALWLAGGAATLVALLVVLRLAPAEAPAATGAAPQAAPADAPDPGFWRLAAAYGCVGYGYVITATFIVASLREGGGSRAEEALVWLAVGLAAIPSVWLWERAARRFGVLRAFLAAMLVEAAGVGLAAVASGAAALTLAAVALGGTFMALTALGLQEAARRQPARAQRAVALMSAAFAAGQMIGPAVAGLLRVETGSYTLPSLTAAAILLTGAAILWPLMQRERAALSA
ncbi:MAG: YbfB/YjiJ family MFS transporter [Pseudomonadota bacterium]